MIRYLKGTIQDREDRTIILLVNGVGYQVTVSNELIFTEENELSLYIHSHIREDQFSLYGFRTKKELKFFELLLTINGVGPKMAMEILNEPAELIQNAIFSGNINELLKISGVGKKTAERIILELKGKVEPSDVNDRTQRSVKTTVNPDVVEALERLGYKRHQIEKILSEADSSNAEEAIRFFLQRV